MNEQALAVINRIAKKLTGRDFNKDEVLDVPAQVQRLIDQATSNENLCQCYIGWYVGERGHEAGTGRGGESQGRVRE